VKRLAPSISPANLNDWIGFPLRGRIGRLTANKATVFLNRPMPRSMQRIVVGKVVEG